MSEDPIRNAAILREAIRRWDASKGDPEIWHDYMSDDVSLWSLGQGRKGVDFSAKRDGRDQLREYLSVLLSNFQMVHYTLDETVAEGNTVVGIGRTAWTAKGTGRTVETPVVIVAKFRGGQIRSWHEYWDTAAALYAAGVTQVPEPAW
jgi:ketosteroid isomerase-like protein